MGGFLSGKNNASNTQPISSTLRIQTSLYGRPVPIGCGRTRHSGNLIWWGNFQSQAAKTPGGKGGAIGGFLGKGSSQTTYSVSAIVSLGEGPIAAYNTIYNGSSITWLTPPSAAVGAALAALGISPTTDNPYPITLEYGTYPQTAWAYLTANFPTQALGYAGEALACFTNLNLGSSASFPSFSWEITWGLYSTSGTGPDVTPDQWIAAFLTNPDWGLNGFPTPLLGDLSAYATFCSAYSLVMSIAMTDQTTAQSHLQDLMKATASDFKWSQGRLTIVPYADLPNTANGSAYQPAVSAVYALTSVDFLPNTGNLGNSSASETTTVSMMRKDSVEAPNFLQLEYLDRNDFYNPVSISVADEGAIQERWVIPTDLRSHHFWTTQAAALQSAALQLGRERVLSQYQFTLAPWAVLLEVFDVVSLNEPALGLNGTLVRIVEIQENDDFSLTFTAELVPQTLGPISYVAQAPLGYAQDANAGAGAINTPIIFEPPTALAASQVWAAVSGVDETMWGGAYVWVSTDGGANYAQVGQISGPSRQGVLTTLLPSVTPGYGGLTTDNTNTLAVDMTESASALATATSADMNALVTLCWVDGELLAYQNATLTSAFHYGLAPMVRGAYGSTIGAHAIGSQFVRLDSNVFSYPYTAGQVGTTISIKFQSYNVHGGGVQDLSTCTVYTHTISGPGGRTETFSPTTTAGANYTQAFSPTFTSGPSGSPTPFVNITWSPTLGDSLNIVSVTTSQVVFAILNGGVQVARAVTIVATGY